MQNAVQSHSDLNMRSYLPADRFCPTNGPMMADSA